MATAAVSLNRCIVPKRVTRELLPYDEIEFGMNESSLLNTNIFGSRELTSFPRMSTGIHNEPVVARSKLQSLEVTVSTLLTTILAPKPDIWHPIVGQPVAVIVNNLGGLSPLEISVIAEEVHRQLD